MLSILKSVIAPIVSLIILMMGNGLITTLTTVRMRTEGQTTFMIGIITASYYLGLFLASFRVDKLIEKIGHIRAFSAFAAFSAALIMMQGLYVNPWGWIVIRFFSGICLAGLFVAIESWLLVKSTKETRGKVLSIYMIAYYAALAIGQYLLDTADPKDITLFCTAVIFSAFSIVPICVIRTTGPVMQEPSVFKINSLWKISPLAVLGSVLSGMILGAVYGLSPVYAQEVGLSVPEIANFMGLTILGGLFLQWPIGHFSDHFDRRKVLLITSVLTAATALIIALFDNTIPNLLLGSICLFGGLSFALYPLCISHACDQVEPKDTVAATGALLLSYGVGSIVGPNIAPIFMFNLGPKGLFFFYLVISSLITLACLWRISVREPVPAEEKLPYSNIPRTTPLAGELDPRSDIPPEDSDHINEKKAEKK